VRKATIKRPVGGGKFEPTSRPVTYGRRGAGTRENVLASLPPPPPSDGPAREAGDANNIREETKNHLDRRAGGLAGAGGATLRKDSIPTL